MNLRTVLIAAGATLALVAPATAGARAVTNLEGDAAVAVNHGSHGAAAVKGSEHKSSKARSSTSKTTTGKVATRADGQRAHGPVRLISDRDTPLPLHPGVPRTSRHLRQPERMRGQRKRLHRPAALRALGRELRQPSTGQQHSGGRDSGGRDSCDRHELIHLRRRFTAAGIIAVGVAPPLLPSATSTRDSTAAAHPAVPVTRTCPDTPRARRALTGTGTKGALGAAAPSITGCAVGRPAGVGGTSGSPRSWRCSRRSGRSALSDRSDSPSRATAVCGRFKRKGVRAPADTAKQGASAERGAQDPTGALADSGGVTPAAQPCASPARASAGPRALLRAPWLYSGLPSGHGFIVYGSSRLRRGRDPGRGPGSPGGGASRRWLSTTESATSASLRPVRWECSRSSSKARSALTP